MVKRSVVRQLGDSVPAHKPFFHEQVKKDFFFVEFVLRRSPLYAKHEDDFQRLFNRYKYSMFISHPDFDQQGAEKHERARRDLWLWILSRPATRARSWTPPGAG